MLHGRPRSGGRRQVPPQPPTPPANPWLPWVEPERQPSPDRGREILVIIPCGGRSEKQLRRCLECLYAASEEVTLRVVVVLCKVTPARTRRCRNACAGLAELIELEGEYTYARSLNVGLTRRTRRTGYVLALNDDCDLRPGALAALRGAIIEEGWCAAGPLLSTDSPYYKAQVVEARSSRSEPLWGCCVLWDVWWLDRIGTPGKPYDERFTGYGFDEPEMLLQCRRLGAYWGIEPAARAHHYGHHTEEEEAANNSLRFRANLHLFHALYGAHEWGASEQWMPLPGLCVVMCGHNVAPWLPRCLASIEASLAGHRWALAYADDDSSDGSLEIAERYPLSCGARVSRAFAKAATVGQAKNRALALAQPLLARYPAVLLMDADDEMLPGRAQLVWQARDRGALAVSAPWETVSESGVSRLVLPDARSQYAGQLGPWATVLHRSLVTPGLFNEVLRVSDDSELWARWWADGTIIHPLGGLPVHRYHRRAGSVVSNATPVDRAAWATRRAEILGSA